MKILICPDKFKGSLSAKDVCDAIAEGIRPIHPDAAIWSVPMADGGEGTCALLTEWHQGSKVSARVSGPVFTPVLANYGVSKDRSTAFIEMAEASGLTLLKPEQRNPLLTSSIGTGEMIADALDRGVKRIILGIGGSATNDAGIGMAAGLGYVFLDAAGDILKPTGENLIHLHSIKTDKLHPRLKEVQFTALCDVTNRLYGPDGAAYVYAPQKGADSRAVEFLDAGLRNFKLVVYKQFGISVDFPGAGAAGGLGAGAKVFLNASMTRGVNYIIESTDLITKIRESNLVITGEGKIDSQTFSGKVVSEIIQHATRVGKPVVVVCGVSEVPASDLRSRGIDKVISLVDEHTPPDSAMNNAFPFIIERVRRELIDLNGLN